MEADTEHETRVRYARVLRTAMDRTGLTQQELADHLRCSRALVQQWRADGEKAQMRLFELARAPRDLARFILDALAEDHGLELAPATEAGALDHQAHFRVLMRSLNEAYEHYDHVLHTHDGYVTDDELRSLEVEVRGARDALATLAAWIRAEKANRGVL